MSERFRCAGAAAAAAEPRYATASTVRRWLLVEQPGPWGSDAVRESRMPTAVADALTDLGRRLTARVLLIRRPAGDARDGTSVYVAFTGTRTRWLESFVVDGPAAVEDLELAPLRHGRRVGGRAEADPLLLVCTNGRHDPCCAELGRPVADALHRAFGSAVWEVSHIGGDRFAGNVVTLPDGIYYGGLDATRAVDVAAAHLAGRLALDAYRGRSAYPFVVQAAEFFIRRELGLDGVDALRWTGREQVDDERWCVTFDTPAGPRTVVLVAGRALEPRRLTCHADRPVSPPRYDLISLDVGG